MLGNNAFHSKIKLKLFKYQFVHKFTPNNNHELLNRKIVRLNVKLGAYKKAIQYYEELFFHHHQSEFYFHLLYLYIMSDKQDKINWLKSNYTYSTEHHHDVAATIDDLNNCINNSDKLQFIQNYIQSKGARPIFLLMSGRGRVLKKKSPEEVHLLANAALYVNQRKTWAESNTPPDYIRNLYTKEHQGKIKELYKHRAPVIKATKVLMPDFDNGLVSVSNGLRTTKYQPETYDKRIMFFGSSTTFSYGSCDEDTLISQIQKEVNLSHKHVQLENHAVPGMSLLLAMNNLTQTNIQPGDIVVLFDFDEFKTTHNDNILKIDLNHIQRGNDFFIDLEKAQCHYSPQGNKKLAQVITDRIIGPVLNHHSSYDSPSAQQTDSSLNRKISEVLDSLKYFLYKQVALSCESGEMKSYLQTLEQYTVSPELKAGSIAVNCNPVTNGHMHLINYASSKVDKLFIFVIEEDQSFFSFRDRLKLVKESTKHIENITVLPGGKFICTELTYPDYFSKEDKNDVISDASMEAWFFCEYIAEKLNIKTIFLGDEPTCFITQQYNEKMKERLPEYDIKVDIIDRISNGEKAISASTVRACLKNQDFDTIKALVPTPTYLFLKEKYAQTT